MTYYNIKNIMNSNDSENAYLAAVSSMERLLAKAK